MKTTQVLSNHWSLAQLEPQETLDFSKLHTLTWHTLPQFPMQVQDVLLHYGLLPREVLVGWCDDAKWIADYDWVYQCTFASDVDNKPTFLKLFGVDTIADVYLNGKLIAKHDDFFLPCEAEITGMLRNDNTLTVHFHNIQMEEKKRYYNPEWEGMVDHWKIIRKPGHDRVQDIPHGSNYQGAHPYFTPIGLYESVEIIRHDRAAIVGHHIRAELTPGYAIGNVRATVDVHRYSAHEALWISCKLTDAQGAVVSQSRDMIPQNGQAACLLSVANPMLWYPRGFGAPYLYRFSVDISRSDSQGNAETLDTLTKTVGFKDVQMVGDMAFVINGKKVRLLGGSMDPFQGYTHVWQPDRVERLLQLVENAHMNTLRCWGEGVPYNDAFYEETDRRGILVWQEFFLGFAAYPDTDEFRAAIRKESEYLVKRLRHHVSLLFWCGGNETRMGAEFIDRTRPFYGEAIQTQDLPEIVARLDPGRYYHESSPSIGKWANDPETGDYHTYDCIWQYHGAEYPNFVSEHIRTSPPVMHSLKKFVREEDFWPASYTGMQVYPTRFPLPDSWMERVHWPADMHKKTGPFWEYYDANTPEEMLYRFGASYAQEMRDGLERVRMGSREGGLGRRNRSRGHLSCKLNDTWPKSYCAVIDFFGEGFMPYYATLRGQAPVLLCFDNHDSINLWLVNDSSEDISGTVTFALFDTVKNQFTDQKEFQVRMPQGEGDIVLNLNYLRFFRKTNLLYARFTTDDGRVLSSVVDYVDIQRHMRFPDAKLSVTLEGDTLCIETDQFAHCIEILGDADGDPFGWLFSDNYFDLLPGETKRVKVLGKHDRGLIRIKPHYAAAAQTLDFNR